MRTERITRAAHLGVMMGMAVVAPNFDPTEQVKSIFRVMCKTFLELICMSLTSVGIY